MYQVGGRADDLTKPVMVAEDKTFGAGWVGLGSFDDTGKVVAGNEG